MVREWREQELQFLLLTSAIIIMKSQVIALWLLRMPLKIKCLEEEEEEELRL
jgi:hypothetical protein